MDESHVGGKIIVGATILRFSARCVTLNTIKRFGMFLSKVYLSLYFHISIFNKKNYRYLEEFIKIAYFLYKHFLSYFNKFYK